MVSMVSTLQKQVTLGVGQSGSHDSQDGHSQEGE